MPDFGTARCDFPGGDAAQLFRCIQRLYDLPDTTRTIMCHDYKAHGRNHFAWESTIGEQKKNNIQIHLGVTENEFVKMRTDRDSTLNMLSLIIPSVQVNIRGGKLSDPEDNGKRYLKIPHQCALY